MNSGQGVDTNSLKQFAYVCGNPLMSGDPTGMKQDAYGPEGRRETDVSRDSCRQADKDSEKHNRDRQRSEARDPKGEATLSELCIVPDLSPPPVTAIPDMQSKQKLAQAKTVDAWSRHYQAAGEAALLEAKRNEFDKKARDMKEWNDFMQQLCEEPKKWFPDPKIYQNNQCCHTYASGGKIMRYKSSFFLFASPSWFLFLIFIILQQLINNNVQQLFVIKWSITLFLSGFFCGVIGIIIDKLIEKSTSTPYASIILLGLCWSIANSIFWKSTALALFFIGMPTDIKIPSSYLLNNRTFDQILTDVAFFHVYAFHQP